MKKALAFALAAAMVVTAFPVTNAEAASTAKLSTTKVTVAAGTAKKQTKSIKVTTPSTWKSVKVNVSSSNRNKIASVLNKEAYLEWGGKNQINSSSPIDFTLNPFLSGNKLAALTRSDVSLYREISTNGTSWIDWTNSDDDKKVFMGDTDYQS